MSNKNSFRREENFQFVYNFSDICQVFFFSKAIYLFVYIHLAQNVEQQRMR